ncbi:MAG: hypothetical protein UT66_C0022G0011 [candidate division CPR2 bacterium GW2011_GWC1_39_9]|uniref:Methyltransferase type 11 domain-containing protein n=1 Tax=candidate division CPR2 bacterium GW2011_GWC2_39_10 TaxID=1618345 RepID=A0A0G0LSG1_UNCC2|nr:MAG: hypothetical protein UT18_C0007G0109 [candidate division CPR2 bacterium GW2011_GWC2_39_10]KKR34518.1 MAG: hypothetical protein UT66_C0022G0011 [candidate division CPR2 bacterium GW2011_GWC1_39_9]
MKQIRFISKKPNRRAGIISGLLKGEIPEGSKVLDIGSGPGVVGCQVAKDYKSQVHGLDIKDRNTASISFKVYDGEHMPFKDQEFDIGLLIFTLHHTKDPDQVLKEAKRVCRKIIILEDLYATKLDFLLLALNDIIFNTFTINRETKLPFNFRTIAGWKHIFDKLGLMVEKKKIGLKVGGFFPISHVLFVLTK